MRALDPNMQAALSAGVIVPAILCQLSFTSGTQYIWSGVGNLVWNGNTFTGVGTLGSIGAITEGTTVKANGTTVTLSGISASLYGDCMDDIQLGASASLWFALLSQGTIIGTPYMIFGGMVDQPTVSEGADTISITLDLETRLTNLQRPNMRRYTSADQRLLYPTDNSMQWVEQMNDEALIWGT
jgi:hypothetical protein